MYSSAVMPRSSSICGLTNEVLMTSSISSMYTIAGMSSTMARYLAWVSHSSRCACLSSETSCMTPCQYIGVPWASRMRMAWSRIQTRRPSGRMRRYSVTKSRPDAFDARCSSITRSRSSGCSISIQTPGSVAHSDGEMPRISRVCGLV